MKAIKPNANRPRVYSVLSILVEENASFGDVLHYIENNINAADTSTYSINSQFMMPPLYVLFYVANCYILTALAPCVTHIITFSQNNHITVS